MTLHLISIFIIKCIELDREIIEVHQLHVHHVSLKELNFGTIKFCGNKIFCNFANGKKLILRELNFASKNFSLFIFLYICKILYRLLDFARTKFRKWQHGFLKHFKIKTALVYPVQEVTPT